MKYASVRNLPSASLATTAYWENFLDADQLDYLCKLVDAATEPGGIGATDHPVVDASVRRSCIAWLERNHETDAIWERVADAVSRANATYFQYALDGFFEPGQLTRYDAEVSGHYDWHQDVILESSGVMRKLSCALLLNDPSEFTGGEFLLKANSDAPDVVEQKRGRMWCFPAWMLHKVTPVTSGRRKTLVFWVGGPPFR